MGLRFDTEDGVPTCVAEVATGRNGIYLDNDVLIELATGDAARRNRFLRALAEGGELLFSWTHAAEVTGPQGGSAEATSDFLRRVGVHWVPLEGNPFVVADREQAGVPRERSPIAERFVKSYVEQRLSDLSADGTGIIDLSDTFFDLSAVAEWARTDRDCIRAEAVKADGAVKRLIERIGNACGTDRAVLDERYPPIRYDPLRPACFALRHLLRTLVIERKAFQFKDGDAADLCHAVIGTAYGSIATLDRQWKRRVERLPGPNGLACPFYRPQIGELVDTFEALIVRSNTDDTESPT